MPGGQGMIPMVRQGPAPVEPVEPRPGQGGVQSVELQPQVALPQPLNTEGGDNQQGGADPVGVAGDGGGSPVLMMAQRVAISEAEFELVQRRTERATQRAAEGQLFAQACHATLMGLFGVALTPTPSLWDARGGETKQDVSDPWQGVDCEERQHLEVIYGEGQALTQMQEMRQGRENSGQPSQQDLFTKRTVYAVHKARVVHTRDNPTPRMLEEDPELAALWHAATVKEISGAIAKGHRTIITDEEKLRDGWVETPMVWVYSTKRDGRRKCRATTDGSKTPKSFFDEDYLYAEGLPMTVMRLITGFAAYFRMRDRTTDVVGCFAALNHWHLSPYPRLLTSRLTAYQSPTGEPVWVANLTNSYGGRDGPGQWRAISADAFEKGGLQQSNVCSQLFYKFSGTKSLLIVGQTTDDFKLAHTDDDQGNAMYVDFMKFLQTELEWEMTEQNPTTDYASIRHTFHVLDGKSAVTLTQPTQIDKLVDAVFGPDREGIPATYLPLPVTWSALASGQCGDTVSTRDFLGRVMSAMWITQTRFESAAVPLLATSSHRPTKVDMEAVTAHVAYLHTTRGLGLTYYEGPKEADIRQTLRLRMYADAGEGQHLDGAAHVGFLLFLGTEEDNPDSGAIGGHSMKAPGAVGESSAVDELMAMVEGIKMAILMKYILEELSGSTRGDWRTTAMSVNGEGSMQVQVSAAMMDGMTSTVSETSGALAMEVAEGMLGQPKGGGGDRGVSLN